MTDTLDTALAPDGLPVDPALIEEAAALDETTAAARHKELADEIEAANKAYYEAVLPLLAENGLLIADNVLWSGRVVEEDGDESTLAIKDFNEHVANDERVVSVMLTVRDGMTLVQKRQR